MRTIIAGSRTIKDKSFVYGILNSFTDFKITEVVCGMAIGVDMIGYQWANDNGLPIKQFPAQWAIHGSKIAGFVRNEEMAKYAEALILIWDGSSKGSQHMLKCAEKHRLRIELITLNVNRLDL